MYEQESLKNIISSAECELRRIKEEVRLLPKGTLQIEKRKNTELLFQNYTVKGTRHRRLVNNDSHTVAGLCRKEYLKQKSIILNNNLSDWKKMRNKYKGEDFNTVMAVLPKRFKQFPEEYFLESRLIENDWGHQPYVQSTFRKEEKIHRTSDGIFVRSKSEALICEILMKYGIQFHYEEILETGEKKYIPDFTIKRADGKIVYWEHCGLTSDFQYMQRHNNKIAAYSAIGILPCKNLIITYDDNSGNIDTHTIETHIKAYLI